MCFHILLRNMVNNNKMKTTGITVFIKLMSEINLYIMFLFLLCITDRTTTTVFIVFLYAYVYSVELADVLKSSLMEAVGVAASRFLTNF